MVSQITPCIFFALMVLASTASARVLLNDDCESTIGNCIQEVDTDSKYGNCINKDLLERNSCLKNTRLYDKVVKCVKKKLKKNPDMCIHLHFKIPEPTPTPACKLEDPAMFEAAKKRLHSLKTFYNTKDAILCDVASCDKSSASISCEFLASHEYAPETNKYTAKLDYHVDHVDLVGIYDDDYDMCNVGVQNC